jgi:spermidine/putrescine transport system permease protein
MTNKTSYLPKIILIIFFSLFYLPIITIIIQSFIIDKKLNFSGYLQLFEDKEIIYGFINSFFLAITSTLITIYIALSAIKYFFLNGTTRIFLFFNLLNLILPETVLAIALLLFFTYFNITLGFITLLISHVMLSLGYVMPLLYQKWLDINKLFITAAYDLGANNEFVWKTIILKLLQPTILTTGFLSFILSFDDYIFSFFCSSVDTLTIINPLLSLLKNGLNIKVKALFVCMIFFSFLLTIFYLFYIGFNYEE